MRIFAKLGAYMVLIAVVLIAVVLQYITIIDVEKILPRHNEG